MPDLTADVDDRLDHAGGHHQPALDVAGTLVQDVGTHRREGQRQPGSNPHAGIDNLAGPLQRLEPVA